MNKLFVFLAVAIASFLPDVISKLLRLLEKTYSLDYKIRQYIGFVNSADQWKYFLFGFCLSLTIMAVTHPNQRVAKQEYIGFAFLCGVVPVILPYVFIFISPPLAAAGINPTIVYFAGYALFVAALSAGGIKTRIGAIGILATGIAGIATL